MMDEDMIIEERMKPEAKRDKLKIFDGFLWVFTVIVGVVTGIAGSLAVSVASMNNYATLYNQWIGTDTEITNAEAKEALDWIMASPWTVYFQSPKAQDDFLSSMILVLTGLGILFLAGTVLLCVFSGRFSREEDGTIHLNWFDRIWSEVQLALFCCAATAADGDDVAGNQSTAESVCAGQRRFVLLRTEQYDDICAVHCRNDDCNRIDDHLSCGDGQKNQIAEVLGKIFAREHF